MFEKYAGCELKKTIDIGKIDSTIKPIEMVGYKT